MNYEVAVVSHARADSINGQTLRVLAEKGVPPERVRVFVAPEQVEAYRRALDGGLHAEVVAGALGCSANHNAVSAWYPEGQLLVSVDDDLTDVRRRVSDKAHEPVVDLPAEVFREGFAALDEYGAGLWGVYPILNPMFMRPRTSVGLYFCIGQLWGCVNTHRTFGQVALDPKDDYERSLRWFTHHGCVVRLDWIAPKTRMHAPGGMQADGQPDRREANERSVAAFLAEFGPLVRVAKRVNAKTGTEIRLVAPRHS